MGSIISSEGYEVPEPVARKLVELGDVFCTAGDEEVGQLLKELCHSPGRILSLRSILLQAATLSKNPINDLGISTVGAPATSDDLWLGSFVSTSGEFLTDTQQHKLSRLFRQWASGSGVDKLKADALSWCEDPSIFCETAPRSHISSSSELVAVYFDEYECIENAHIRNRPRRRAILLETFWAIQREEQHLRRSKKTKLRQDSQTKLSVPSSASIRSRAVGSIANRLWGGLFSPQEFIRRKERLLRMSRYGEKWSLIKPKGILLALGGESQFFEQQKWATIEAEAMNKYLKSMPIYSIQPILESAMVAITREWSGQSRDQRITRLPLAFQPNNQIPDVAMCNAKSSDDGLQMLLDAVSAAGYGTIENGMDPPRSSSQGVGDQQNGGTQLASPDGFSLFGEGVGHLYQMSDFEVASSPFIDFMRMGTATSA